MQRVIKNTFFRAFLYLFLPVALGAQTLQHRYSFTSDASDSIKGANANLAGSAQVANKALNLPGGGNSDNPVAFGALPNGIVSNCTSITVDCWLTDVAGGVWAEAWCFGDSSTGAGQPPGSGTAYISLIPHSYFNDMRVAFNNDGSEVDVEGPAQSPLPLGVEQYVSISYDAASSTARLYLNGVRIGQAAVPPDHAPSTYGNTFNNWLGRDEWGADPMFAGSIDELRIWNGAVTPLYEIVSAAAGPDTLVTSLTPTELSLSVTNSTMANGKSQPANIMASFLQVQNVIVTSAATNWASSDTNVLTVNSSGLVTATGDGHATISAMVGGISGISGPISVTGVAPGNIVTVGYWKFDNAANLGFDSSGLGNTLITAAGEPTYSSSGNFGGAVYLDGNSAMTTAGFPLDFPTNANPYTIAVWEKVDAGCPNNGGFIGWGVNNTSLANNFRLDGPYGVDDYWYANDFVVDGLAVNPMDGNWHALAVTWDGTTQTMYVDGASVGTRTPALPTVQPANFVVGRTTSDVAFQGWVEDLLVARTALSPADLSVYQSGNWSAAVPAYPELPIASPSNNVFAGTTVTLSVLVSGAPPYQYQWRKNGGAISWGTSATLVLTNAGASNSGSYDVVVGNSIGTNVSPALTVTVNAPNSPIFSKQPAPAATTNYVGSFVTFSASVSGTLPIQLQWQHNGVSVPNATSSSLTLASLQTSAAGTYTLIASNSLGVATSAPAVLTVLTAPNPAGLNVVTYHYDNARDGANTNETTLTPANVNVSTFGRLLQYPTDGKIIAQPLYVSGVTVPGQGTHNIVYVATENNSVYAFDADSNAGANSGLIWHTNLGTAISSYNGEFGTRYQGTYYGDIVPVVGITGTPVIDLNSGTLYVNVHSREVTTSINYYHRIHALNITNGMEQTYSPVIVTNSVPGKGRDSTNGIVGFDAIVENQRPGLTLAGGMLYVGYGSYADTDPYHGWVLGFNATNLGQSASYAFNTTPNATVARFGQNAAEGALWMGGNGLCADSSNNIYFATANGSFSANTNGGDYSDSFVKLSTTNGMKVADYFTPYNQATLASQDADLGSGGTILLPDSVGSVAHPHLMVGAGKMGTIHLVDRDNMGQFHNGNDTQIVQEAIGVMNGVWSTPAYFNNHIYFQPSGDVMRSFFISNGVVTPTPTSVSKTAFSALGGTPFITANGTNNGIVWTLQSDANDSGGPNILHAYNATNLGQELYNSSQNLARDNPGAAIKMTAPMAVNGKVFVGSQYVLSIFGNSLFLNTPTISPAGGVFTNAVTVTVADTTPNATIYYTLDGTTPTTNSILYTGPFVLTTSANVQAIATEPGAVNSGVANVGFVNTAAVGNGTGLQAAYWSNLTSQAFTNASFAQAPTLIRLDPTVNFNWSSVAPSPAIGLTNFVVRWLGSLQPEYGETYNFTTKTANGVRLLIDGQLLINHWTNQQFTAWSNSIALKAQQRYTIEMDFYNQTAGAQAQLYWGSPSTPNTIIPQNQLYPVTNPSPSIILTSPAKNSTYTAAASVTMTADADTLYNDLSFVNFYTNGGFVGTVSNAPYQLTATGWPVGNYAVTASGTDASGLVGTSAPVSITIKVSSGLPYGLASNPTLGAFLNQKMPGAFAGAMPQTLSATGAYVDTPNRVPASGLIPYAPNTPLWSDGAVKSRYLGLAYAGGLMSPSQQIGFGSTGQWSFPAGTVFVKNFDLVVNTTNANVPVRRLETRLIVLDTNGAVYGVTYKWRADNSDADLLTGSLVEAVQVTNATGVTTQNWYYPSPADCLTCHTAPAGYVLGVNSRQLNGNLTYATTGVTDNQLRTLNRLGLFNPAFDEAAISGYEKLSSITNALASVQERARSYLDANCAQCHQPGGTGITFDARYDTALANQHIVGTTAAFSLGVDNAQVVAPSDVWRSVLYARMDTENGAIKMPPLARNIIDTNAVSVMAEWINSLGGLPTLPPPQVTPVGGTFTGLVNVTAEDATNATLYYTLDGSLPTTNSSVYTGPIVISDDATLNVNAWAPNYMNSIATTAQFTILPGAYFTSAIGFTNGSFQMTFAGTPGSIYVLQMSTNLLDWTSISTNTATGSSLILADPGVSGAERFYRAFEQ